MLRQYRGTGDVRFLVATKSIGFGSVNEFSPFSHNFKRRSSEGAEKIVSAYAVHSYFEELMSVSLYHYQISTQSRGLRLHGSALAPIRARTCCLVFRTFELRRCRVTGRPAGPRTSVRVHPS